MVVGKRNARVRLQLYVGIKCVGEDAGGRGFAIGPAENEPQADTLALEDRQRFLGVVLEARLRVLVGLGQRDPGLNPIPAVRSFARLGGVRSECVISRPATIQLT
jgi:hypothetical protein